MSGELKVTIARGNGVGSGDEVQKLFLLFGKESCDPAAALGGGSSAACDTAVVDDIFFSSELLFAPSC